MRQVIKAGLAKGEGPCTESGVTEGERVNSQSGIKRQVSLVTINRLHVGEGKADKCKGETK